jgi:hypothetical protein
MTTEHQHEQRERIETMRNDADVRRQQQSNTMHGRAVAEASIETGRFTAVNAAHVTGSTTIPQYPQASTPWQGPDPVGDEPPLGFAIDQMPIEPSAEVSILPVEQLAPDGAAAAADKLPPASAQPSDSGASLSYANRADLNRGVEAEQSRLDEVRKQADAAHEQLTQVQKQIESKQRELAAVEATIQERTIAANQLNEGYLKLRAILEAA